MSNFIKSGKVFPGDEYNFRSELAKYVKRCKNYANKHEIMTDQLPIELRNLNRIIVSQARQHITLEISKYLRMMRSRYSWKFLWFRFYSGSKGALIKALIKKMYGVITSYQKAKSYIPKVDVVKLSKEASIIKAKKERGVRRSIIERTEKMGGVKQPGMGEFRARLSRTHILPMGMPTKFFDETGRQVQLKPANEQIKPIDCFAVYKM